MASAPATEPSADVHDSRSKANGSDLKPDHEEYQYLDLIRQILANGEHRPDRFIDPDKLQDTTGSLSADLTLP